MEKETVISCSLHIEPLDLSEVRTQDILKILDILLNFYFASFPEDKCFVYHQIYAVLHFSVYQHIYFDIGIFFSKELEYKKIQRTMHTALDSSVYRGKVEISVLPNLFEYSSSSRVSKYN
jgi:hypothetical protein